MNDIIITDRGQYQYDADFDIYRRVPEPKDLTHLNQYGWIYICLAILAFVLCFKNFG